jgi:hypothetical protein
MVEDIQSVDHDSFRVGGADEAKTAAKGTRVVMKSIASVEWPPVTTVIANAVVPVRRGERVGISSQAESPTVRCSAHPAMLPLKRG